MCEKHGFAIDRRSWADATANGTPVEIKSTRVEHADGQPGNFKIYEQYHRRLRANDGKYCFAVYKPWGNSGARILKSKIVHSGALPRLNWHGGGEHRGTRQAKLGIDEVFG